MAAACIARGFCRGKGGIEELLLAAWNPLALCKSFFEGQLDGFFCHGERFSLGVAFRHNFWECRNAYNKAPFLGGLQDHGISARSSQSGTDSNQAAAPLRPRFSSSASVVGNRPRKET